MAWIEAVGSIAETPVDPDENEPNKPETVMYFDGRAGIKETPISQIMLSHPMEKFNVVSRGEIVNESFMLLREALREYRAFCVDNETTYIEIARARGVR